MSLFRRPKKANIQRRVFSAIDEDENNANSDGNENAIDANDGIKTPPPPSLNDYKPSKKEKSSTASTKSSSKKTSLLSFDDDGEYTVLIETPSNVIHSDIANQILKYSSILFV